VNLRSHSAIEHSGGRIARGKIVDGTLPAVPGARQARQSLRADGGCLRSDESASNIDLPSIGLIEQWLRTLTWL
jgi:hypothetical protein